jgi:hypothetical protein
MNKVKVSHFCVRLEPTRVEHQLGVPSVAGSWPYPQILDKAKNYWKNNVPYFGKVTK